MYSETRDANAFDEFDKFINSDCIVEFNVTREERGQVEIELDPDKMWEEFLAAMTNVENMTMKLDGPVVADLRRPGGGSLPRGCSCEPEHSVGVVPSGSAPRKEGQRFILPALTPGFSPGSMESFTAASPGLSSSAAFTTRKTHPKRSRRKLQSKLWFCQATECQRSANGKPFDRPDNLRQHMKLSHGHVLRKLGKGVFEYSADGGRSWDEIRGVDI